MARILHVIESLDPRLGGPPAVCVRLAAAQACRGHHVGVLTRSFATGIPASLPALVSVPGIERVIFHEVHCRALPVHRVLAPDIGDFIRSNRTHWDFLHVHSVWDPASRAAGSAARRLGLPYVLTTHGMLDEWGMRQGVLRPWKKAIALRLAIGDVLRNAAFLHALTIGERDGLRRFGFGEQAEVVPNGIFMEEVLPPIVDGDTPEFPFFSGTEPSVLFLGRLHPVKGVDILLRGFQELLVTRPSAHLAVVGPDYGEGSRLLALAGELGINRSVVFAPPVFGAARFALMRRCAVFCQMSRYEGFSVALLEALACGCPVVASEQCRFPEIQKVGAGRIVKSDPVSVAEALRFYLDSIEARLSAGQAGRSLVQSSFTWDRVAERLDSAYAAHDLLKTG